MALADSLSGRIAELDGAIQRATDEARAKISALQREKATLIHALSLVTPDIEATFTALKDLGIIK